ncbi:MAG: DUF4184 family protein [Crocinitomicaceae bacterium]|nr:DUF4184 family protein [Crocinitomicaceae bacterium]
MPFTFSHPAFVLPFCKLNSRYVSASGLIMGSMAPDFEYFIHMRMQREHGHTIAGAFYYDLPLTFICCLLFHWLVRDGLIQNLPKMVREKYAPFLGMNWWLWVRTHWFVFILSALAGIFSHFLVDAFTHTNGYFVQYIPYLQGETHFLGRTFPTPDFWQMMTTLLGAAFIVLAVILPTNLRFNWLEFKERLKYYSTVGGVMVFIVLIRGIQSFGDLIATAIAGGLIGLMVAPVLLRIWRKQSRV